MTGYYRRRKSRAAIWCLRLAVICIPYFILTVLLHRGGSITTPQAFWLLAVGIALLILSLLLGFRAAVDLWEKGYEGGRSMVKGVIISLLMLVPFAFLLAQAIGNPRLNDISTDVLEPPVFLSREVDSPAIGEQGYDDAQARAIVAGYPDIVGRRYNTPPERIMESVQDILKRWGWVVIASRNVPETAQGEEQDATPEGEEENAELAGGQDDAQPAEGEQAEIDLSEYPDIQIQARVLGSVMRLRYDFAIRITYQEDASLVDIRSASHWGAHDFGFNALNIRRFLTELDTQLQGIAGE